MTTNPLVEFLAAYGPEEVAKNQYDEFVVNASVDTGCEPIHIDEGLTDELVDEMKLPRSVILTGTAGDGKTYTARKLFKELNNGGSQWESSKMIQTCRYKGTRIKFIKDLSELGEKKKNKLHPKICSSLEDDSKSIFVICVNDGQLLKFFRDRAHSEPEKRLYEKIRDMVEDNSETSDPLRLRIINMSRRATSDLLDKVMDEITNHPDWTKCDGCSAQNDKKYPCPIQINRELLSQTGDPSIRARLRDMISMVAADGKHLSIRHLILLSVNILLGYQNKSSRACLLTCNIAKRRAKSLDYKSTNPFSNIFGNNLVPSRRRQYEVFAALEKFGVGLETNKFLDQSIMNDSKDIPSHQIYGNKILKNIKVDLNERDKDSIAKLYQSITDQRRRLFFSLSVKSNILSEHKLKDPWDLTVFKYGGSYCHLAKLESSDKNSDQEITKNICKSIILGLNRTMTGKWECRNDQLWIVEPSGNYRGSENISLIATVAEMTNDSQVRFRFRRPNAESPMPTLEVSVGQGMNSSKLPLCPSLTECLLRVSNGAFPYSFPLKIQKKIDRFQLRIVTDLKDTMGNRLSLRELNVRLGSLEMKPIAILLDQEEWL